MKRFFKNETKRLNILLTVLIIIALAVVFFINAIFATLSEQHPLSIDLTANAVYDIGDDSKEVLNSLTSDVQMYVLATKGNFSGNAYLTQVRNILEKYPKYCSHVSLEFIDYTKDPSFAAQYPNFDLSTGDVLVEGPEMIKQIPLANMFNYTYDSNNSLVVASSRAEEAITSAIVSAVTADPVNVGILTGNSVLEDRGTLKAIMENNNFVVSELNMVTEGFDGFEVLMLLEPMDDISEDILKKLDDFLYNGGQYGKTLIYSAGADQGEFPNMAAFLREWGISVNDGAVFETSENYAYGYQPYYPFVDYTDETFKAMMKDAENMVLMPISKPLSLVFDYKDNKTVTTLLSFSPSSGVRPSDAGNNFTVDQATVRGPIPALTMTTWAPAGANGMSNVIVSASTQLFASSLMSNTSVANAEYLMAVLNTVTARDDAVTIESKSLAGNQLAITTSAARIWSVVLCIVIPLLIMAVGIFIYMKRRHI